MQDTTIFTTGTATGTESCQLTNAFALNDDSLAANYQLKGHNNKIQQRKGTIYHLYTIYHINTYKHCMYLCLMAVTPVVLGSALGWV